MENNDRDLLTVNDIRRCMRKTYVKTFSVKWMSYKLKEKCGDRLVRCQKRGMDDVIFLSRTASSLLCEFIQKQCFDGVSNEKDRIITLAAELIAQDIKGIESDLATYFSFDEIDVEKQLNMMTFSLKNLISHAIPKRSTADRSTNIAMFCQVSGTLQSSYKGLLWK